MNTNTSLHTDWSTYGTAKRRNSFYAASQSKFVPFKEPIVFKKGSMQYLWDADGNKYIDLLGMNVCIFVGHSHPKVVAAAMEHGKRAYPLHHDVLSSHSRAFSRRAGCNHAEGTARPCSNICNSCKIAMRRSVMCAGGDSCWQ